MVSVVQNLCGRRHVPKVKQYCTMQAPLRQNAHLQPKGCAVYGLAIAVAVVVAAAAAEIVAVVVLGAAKS